MLKKAKDIAYDINDVIVVLVVLAAAALLIWTRLEVIMAYPSAGGAVTILAEKTQEGEGLPGADGSGQDRGGGVQEPEASLTPDAVALAPPPAPEDDYPYSVYIAYGETAGEIAQKLVGAEIINDKNEFLDAMIAAGADRSLQAGSFIIPKKSTPTDIVRILSGG